MLIDISFIIFIWFLLALVFIAIGLSFQKFFWPAILDFQSTITAFWFGWGIVLAALQWWHLFLPVNWNAQVFFFLFGILCLVLNKQHVTALLRSCFLDHGYFTILVFCFVVLTACFALRGELPYDAGLYHLQYIKWVSQFAIIPGIGNLHVRFAFNSSYFLYLALLKPITAPVAYYYFASGLLVSICIIQSLYPVFKVFKADPRDRFDCRDLMSISFIFVWLFLACKKITTTSPDLAIYLMGFTVSMYLSEMAFQLLTRTERIRNVLIILFLSMVGISLKASFLVFGACSIIAALSIFLSFEKTDSSCLRKENARIFIFVFICCAILSLWLIRDDIQSGYPIFPSPIGGINVDWKIPSQTAISLLNVVKSWAQAPGEDPLRVLGDHHWLVPWMKSIYKCHKHDVILPVSLFLGGLLSSFFLFRKLYSEYGALRPILFFFPPACCLLAWFISAPEPRFAGASFLILGIGMISMLISLAPIWWQRRYIIGVFCCSFILCLGLFLINKRRAGGQYSIPTVQVEKRITNSGLLVYVPLNSDQCWDASLPCSPVFNANLTLRHRQDIQKGFKIQQP